MNPLVLRARRSQKRRLLRQLIVGELLSAGGDDARPYEIIDDYGEAVARHEIRPTQAPSLPAPAKPGVTIPLPGHPSLN